MLETVFKAGMSLVLGFFSGRDKNIYFKKEKNKSRSQADTFEFNYRVFIYLHFSTFISPLFYLKILSVILK